MKQRAVPLSSLLTALPDASVTGDTSATICDITDDSRQVRPGSLFVALPSLSGGPGGERFVADVVSRGAAAVVLPAGIAASGATVITHPNPRAALADLSAAFFGHPSQKLRLFAVTGTDGKTTTTYLLEQILSHAGRCTGLIGTVEVKVGERREPNLDRMTTPPAVDVQRLLRDMVEAGVTDVAVEASSHALALDRLRGCRIEAAALTNITGDHVEFHGSWAAYVAAKTSLFTELAAGRPVLLNADDPSVERLRALRPDALTYGIDAAADLQASHLTPRPGGTRFRLSWADESVDVDLRIPARYNVANATAAAGLALLSGASLCEVADGLSQAAAPPGRFQRVEGGQDFAVLVDYAHTMHAFRSLLADVRAHSAGRVIAVFGATGDRDRAKRPVLARIAAEHADLAFVTNEDPYSEDPEAIVDEILSGIPAGAETIFTKEVDRGCAIRRAIASAEAGDTVVIMGKGHEKSIVVGGRKVPWDDVEVARQALEALL